MKYRMLTTLTNRLRAAGALLAVSLMVMSGTTPSAMAQDQVPAFPGAEGFARYTVTGGRGGSVYHVTTLEDNSKPGSLRYGLENMSGARTIVFDVAGYIDLNSLLIIKNGNVTIAGQTAPKPGITVRYYTVQNKASNVIVRFIRFRRSQVKDVDDGADATWGRQCRNIILDHCSFSWSIDEIASYYDNRDFTMQWCALAEGLRNAGHGKGPHSYGGIWGGKNATFHHNLIAHVSNRAPRLNGARFNWSGYDKTVYKNSVEAERVDLRNCVMYNWGEGNGAYGAMGGYTNIVNNYYKAGPATKNKTRVFQCSVNASKDSKGALPDGLMGMFYINGNYVTEASSPANYDWTGVSSDGGFTYTDVNGYYANAGDQVSIKLTEPIAYGTVTTHSAEVAYEKSLAYVGQSLYRDTVDVRVLEEMRTKTATYKGDSYQGIVDMINDPTAEEQDKTKPSFPELKSTTRPANFDTDGDGMPDEWETTYGLDPNDATDGATKTLDPLGWYTNLECYINSIVEPIMKACQADALDAEHTVNEYYPVLGSKTTDFVPDEVVDTKTNSPVTVTKPAAVKMIYDMSQVKSIEYFSLDGRSIPEPGKGMSLRCITLQNGQKITDKVISTK